MAFDQGKHFFSLPLVTINERPLLEYNAYEARIDGEKAHRMQNVGKNKKRSKKY
jgi:hypothetical protein